MALGSELRIQNLKIVDIALGTLGANTALLLSSQMATTIDRAFLVKKVKYWLKISGLTAGEGPLIAGISNGDASVAEVAAAFGELNTVGPSDTTQERTQDNVANVWQNTWRPFRSNANAVEAELYDEISLGKGMVARENQGIALDIFNADAAALTTGAVCKGTVQLWGVWLK